MVKCGTALRANPAFAGFGFIFVLLLASRGLGMASSSFFSSSPYPNIAIDGTLSKLLTGSIEAWLKQASSTSYPSREWLEQYFVKHNFFYSLSRISYLSSTSLKQLKGSIQKIAAPVGVTKVGIGIAGEQESGWMMIVAFFRPKVRISTFTSFQAEGSSPVLKGKVFPGYREKTFYLTLPNGEVEKLKDKDERERSFLINFPSLQEKGEYAFEIVIEEPSTGPEIGMLIPLYVGVEPQSKHTLSFQPKDLSEGEQYIVDRINAERRKFGRKALQIDPLLAQVARSHSRDMATRGFFAHINPDGLDASARFKRAGGKGKVGENLAKNSDLASAHQSLMSSPGHRANILNKDYTHVGVGLYFDGKSYFLTELFAFFPKKVDIFFATDQLLVTLQSFAQETSGRVLQRDPLLSAVAAENAKENASKESLDFTIRGTRIYPYYKRQGGTFHSITCGAYLAYSEERMEKQLKKHFSELAQNAYTHIGIGLAQGDYKSYSNALYATICFKK